MEPRRQGTPGCLLTLSSGFPCRVRNLPGDKSQSGPELSVELLQWLVECQLVVAWSWTSWIFATDFVIINPFAYGSFGVVNSALLVLHVSILWPGAPSDIMPSLIKVSCLTLLLHDRLRSSHWTQAWIETRSRPWYLFTFAAWGRVYTFVVCMSARKRGIMAFISSVTALIRWFWRCHNAVHLELVGCGAYHSAAQLKLS